MLLAGEDEDPEIEDSAKEPSSKDAEADCGASSSSSDECEDFGNVAESSSEEEEDSDLDEEVVWRKPRRKSSSRQLASAKKGKKAAAKGPPGKRLKAVTGTIGCYDIDAPPPNDREVEAAESSPQSKKRARQEKEQNQGDKSGERASMGRRSSMGLGGANLAFRTACKALQISSVPASLPCREKERDQIRVFLETALRSGEGKGSCLYISGVPGTGKTASVYEVVRSLQSRSDSGQLPPFHFVEVNGMRLQHPQQAYSIMWHAISGRLVAPKSAALLLDKHFASKDPDRECCVVLADEVDALVTRNQRVLYNMFDWPAKPQSRLVLIAIGNTIDMLDRLLPRNNSRLSMQRLMFQPYSRVDLQTILSSRLASVKAFDPDAIELCARKVASAAGDVRRALEMCRRGVELAEREYDPSKDPLFSSRASYVPVKLVTIHHIERAMRDSYSSTYVTLLQNASRFQQIAVAAVFLGTMKGTIPVVSFQKVFDQHAHLSRKLGEIPLRAHLLRQVVHQLVCVRMLLMETASSVSALALRLNFPADDIVFALRNDPLSVHIR